MSALEKLALGYVKELAEQLDQEIINAGSKIDKGLDREKDMYPLASKARKIARWIEAINQ